MPGFHLNSTRVVTLLLCCAPLVTAAVQPRLDPDSGQMAWKVDDRGFSLELLQLVPDYVRAVYGLRGFSKELIEDIARYCVFGSVAINTSDRPLSYRVADWRYRLADGSTHALKTKSDWIAQWKRAGIPFNWTLLPDDVTFEVGDWAQGFTTVLVPRDQPFDLEYSWTIGDQTHVGHIDGLRCAPE